MKIAISEHFSTMKLIRFTLPTVIMMVVTSIYTMVDGVFIARYVGGTALSATNIVYPLICVFNGIGIMLAMGGNAIVVRKLGEGDEVAARKDFSLLTCVTIVIGIVFSILVILLLKPISRILGASEILIPYCVEYGIIMTAGITFSMLQILFQPSWVVVGKPKLGLILSLVCGFINIIFDYLFVVTFNLGLAGAGLATVAAYIIGTIVPIIYFVKVKDKLYFVKPNWNIKLIFQSMSNGSSEMVSSIANAITTFLFNIILMNLIGEIGIAAITVLLYAQFLFSSAFIGFTNGVAPVISFHYGANNEVELKNIFRICKIIILLFSIFIFIISQLFAPYAISFFIGKDESLLNLTLSGFKLFSLCFLLNGFNIFCSGFFTALGNGRDSAIISFLRTFIFEVILLIALPYIIDINGVWLAVPLAELLCIIISGFLIVKNRKEYNY